MALLRCDFYSEVLAIHTSMSVILPQASASARGAIQRRPQVLYLLHGLGSDHTTWQRETSIERYVAERDVAVIMPTLHRSFHTDMAHGYRYWTFLSEELPAVVHSFFKLSEAREDTFVAGLSMGGYGAFKWALTQPECFAAAASLSGALEVAHGPLPEDDIAMMAEIRANYGNIEEFVGSPHDLFYLAQQVVESQGPIPRLYQWCGVDDYLYGDNLNFRNWAESTDLGLTYEEGPGDHTWGYWDHQIRRVIDWMALRPLQQASAAASES
jgi:S-formylglutathione hydrolase FrmB